MGQYCVFCILYMLLFFIKLLLNLGDLLNKKICYTLKTNIKYSKKYTNLIVLLSRFSSYIYAYPIRDIYKR